MPEITQANQPVLAYPGPDRLRQVIKTRSGQGVMMFPALRLRRDIACQQAVELVTGYLEGTLARAGRRRFEAHLGRLPALHRVPRSDAQDDRADRIPYPR